MTISNSLFFEKHEKKSGKQFKRNDIHNKKLMSEQKIYILRNDDKIELSITQIEDHSSVMCNDTIHNH